MADERAPLRRYLARRMGGAGWLRAQTALVLGASFLVGGLVSHALLRLGVGDLRWRLPVVVLVSYAAFLGLVGAWLRATGLANLKVRLDPTYREDAAKAEEESAGSSFKEKLEKMGDGISGVGELASVDAEGCLPAAGLAAAVLVAGLLLLILWWFTGGFLGAASAALLEAAVEAVLAVGMVRAAGGSAATWVEGAVRASWLFWAVLTMAALAVAWSLHHLAPEAVTVFQALQAII